MGSRSFGLTRPGWGTAGLIALAALAAAAATVVGYRTHPVIPLAAVAVLALASLPPMTVLHLAVALIPLELATASLEGAAVSATEGTVILAGLGWAARRLFGGHRIFSPSPINVALVLLGLATAVGLVAGE